VETQEPHARDRQRRSASRRDLSGFFCRFVKPKLTGRRWEKTRRLLSFGRAEPDLASGPDMSDRERKGLGLAERRLSHRLI
jgi:hypothetical protein